MDPPATCVSWPSPLPRHSRQNMPGSTDLEQNVICSATKYSSALLRRPRHGVSTDRPSGISQQMNRLQEKQRAVEQCKALKQIAQTVIAQEDHNGLICKESEENQPVRSCETQAVESDSQVNSNKKYCPRLMLVFMTESAEESPEDLKDVQQSNGWSLRSVQEDEKTVNSLPSGEEESPVNAGVQKA